VEGGAGEPTADGRIFKDLEMERLPAMSIIHASLSLAGDKEEGPIPQAFGTRRSQVLEAGADLKLVCQWPGPRGHWHSGPSVSGTRSTRATSPGSSSSYQGQNDNEPDDQDDKRRGHVVSEVVTGTGQPPGRRLMPAGIPAGCPLGRSQRFAHQGPAEAVRRDGLRHRRFLPSGIDLMLGLLQCSCLVNSRALLI